jgi:hypothetical protein
MSERDTVIFSMRIASAILARLLYRTLGAIYHELVKSLFLLAVIFDVVIDHE